MSSLPQVVARVREHFLRTIAKLQKPKTNVMMIQQGALLKVRDALSDSSSSSSSSL